MSVPIKEDFIKKMRDRKGKNGASPGQVNPPEVKAATTTTPTAAAPSTGKPTLAEKMAARKAAQQQAAAPAPEPEPEMIADPLPSAEEEAPKAGRGRPRGSKNAATAGTPEPPPMSEQWVTFAGQGAPHILGTLSDEDLLDPEMQESAAQAIAGFADAMSKEYLGRFGD